MGNGLPVDTVGMSVAAKADRRLVPILMASWFLLQLHRYGISFAALQITESFEMTGAQFGFVAGVLFLGCALFEGPSHFVLTRGGTPRGVGILILVSGVLNVGMAATSSVAGLAWMRFAMGVAQSACLPAMAQCLTPWLPGNLRRSAVASVGSMAMLAGVVGGPIAALAMVLNGVWDVCGWQWVFLLEGL